jgi:hypothetical protein
MFTGSSCPLNLLVKVGWMQWVALGSEVDKAMASELLRWSRKKKPWIWAPKCELKDSIVVKILLAVGRLRV